MIKSMKSEKLLKKIIDTSGILFDLLDEKYVDYSDFNAIYHFFALKKRKV